MIYAGHRLYPPLTTANVAEWDWASDIRQAIEGLMLGDKGNIRPQCKADCAALGIALQTPLRTNMSECRPRWWLRLLRPLRKCIETVVSQFEQRFGLAKTQARYVWHLTNHVTCKIQAYTLGVWLNIQQGREPLELGWLVTV